MFYRTDAGMPWEPVEFTVVGPWSIGYMYVENIQMGEYTLGVWDISVGTDEHGSLESQDENLMHVYPNPSSGTFRRTT